MSIQILIILFLTTTCILSSYATRGKFIVDDVDYTTFSTTLKPDLNLGKDDDKGEFPRKQLADCNRQIYKSSLVSNASQAANRRLNHTTGSWHANGPEFAGLVVHGGFTGGRAKLAIFAPGNVGDKQYSSALISVESGEGNDYNLIQVGWTVNPCLYKDNEIHFFLYAQGVNSQTCWDSHCSDFIPTAGDTALKFGDILAPSKVGQIDQNHLELSILKDDRSGWWFIIANGTIVGFWQGHYFSSLNTQATTVRFGGETYTPAGGDSSPPMGSGVFKPGWPSLTSYMEDVRINPNIGAGFAPENPQTIETRCYYVADVGNTKWFQGLGFFFGGKGGKDQDTCVY
ncbi:hypothetical protein RND81_02G082200 [Saponaria officinalis]|uniref:Neprosin PEP catalytic domain-containing protein n=1 Tax=Saponaria officinalis TaxID=3572 RepID=A0AAW1MKA1_SAPOF